MDYAEPHYDLFVMDANGTRVRALTRLPVRQSVDYAAPTWSRDGRTISFLMVSPRDLRAVYYAGPPTPNGTPYRVSAFGYPRLRPSPHWDVGLLVYPFTSDQQNLPHEEYQAQAQYQCETTSPDGTKIAFYRQYDDGRGAGGNGLSSGVICVMNADRSNERELTQKALSQPSGDISGLPPCPKG